MKKISNQDIKEEPIKIIQPSAPNFEDYKSTVMKDEEDLCKICMVNELECVFYDCGHMICCKNCSKGLTDCPVCRNKIIQSIKVFK